MDHISTIIPELMKALQDAENGQTPLTGELKALKNALRMGADAISMSAMERTYADTVANRPASRPSSPKPGTDRVNDPAPDNGDNNGTGGDAVTTVTPSPTSAMAKKKRRAADGKATRRRQSAQVQSAAAGAASSKTAPSHTRFASPSPTRSASPSPVRSPRRVVVIDMNDDDMDDPPSANATATRPAPRLPKDVKVHPAIGLRLAHRILSHHLEDGGLLGDGGTLYAIRERVGTEIVAGVSQVLYVHRPNLTTRMQTSLTVPGGMD